LFAVDVGGTFTDVVAFVGGEIRTAKVATDYRQVYAPVIAAAAELGVEQASVFNHASTHGLNAVITRNLPKIAFLTTEGHRDILDMGRVWRPASAMMNPHWRRPFGDASRPLVPRYLRRGIRERIMADGQALFDLDEEQARDQLSVLGRCGVQGIAICLLNSYLNPKHELRLRELVREELGDIACSVSSEVSPLAKEYPRSSTTVVDTLLKIIYGDYTRLLSGGLRDVGFRGGLNFADSAATLVPAAHAMKQPFRIVFSGPSAGAVAAAHLGALIGEDHLVCADVGGTSCDISLVNDGVPHLDTTIELEHDLVVNTIAVDVTAIGAGGGSIVHIGAAGEIQVGPESARSDPGPACYGRGGVQPTTTDTCLMIGIVDSSTFAGGRIPLFRELSRTAFEQLDVDLSLARRVRHAYETAVHNIAEGVFNVAIRKGIDPRDYSLLAYGAAGGMLLPATLGQLHCKQVIVPPHPGLFSALGLLSANRVFTVASSAYTILGPGSADRVDVIYAGLEAQLREQLPAGVRATFERTLDGHLVGQSWDTPFVPVPPGRIGPDEANAMVTSFHDTYEQRSGNRFDSVAVEAVTFRVQASLETTKVNYPKLPPRGDEQLVPVALAKLEYLGETEGDEVGALDAQVYDRYSLRVGDAIAGPAIIREPSSTVFVCTGQKMTVGRFGELVIRMC
jgi:N-methylhydantoinase A